MTNNNIKPSVVESTQRLFDRLTRAGLNRDDIVTLIQRRSKVSRRDINATIDAIFVIDKQLARKGDKNE